MQFTEETNTNEPTELPVWILIACKITLFTWKELKHSKSPIIHRIKCITGIPSVATHRIYDCGWCIPSSSLHGHVCQWWYIAYMLTSQKCVAAKMVNYVHSDWDSPTKENLGTGWFQLIKPSTLCILGRCSYVSWKPMAVEQKIWPYYMHVYTYTSTPI